MIRWWPRRTRTAATSSGRRWSSGLVVMAFIRHCCVDAAAVCRLGGSEDSSGRFTSRAREAAEYITARSRSPSNAVSIGEPHPDRSVDGRVRTPRSAHPFLMLGWRLARPTTGVLAAGSCQPIISTTAAHSPLGSMKKAGCGPATRTSSSSMKSGPYDGHCPTAAGGVVDVDAV
jgi:hypothetical protein